MVSAYELEAVMYTEVVFHFFFLFCRRELYESSLLNKTDFLGA